MITRRQFIVRSSAGIIASSIFTKLFRGGLAQAQFRPKFLLRLHCDGGWDPTMVFDPKFDSNHVATGPGSSTASASGITYVTAASRPSVSFFFQAHGAKSVVINGLHCSAVDHEQALQQCLGKRFEKQDKQFIDYLTYYAQQTNPTAAAPHLAINLRPSAGSNVAATSYLDDALIAEYLSATSSEIGSTAEAALANFLNLSFGDTIETRPAFGLDADKISALYHGYKREITFREQFTALHERASTAGQDNFVTQARLGLEMMAAGLSQCATVRVGKYREWDTHRDHFSKQNDLFESLFAGLNQIISAAQQLGLSDDLIILVTSELGRSPKLNQGGGKDHWPYTSMLAWGGALNGGQVLGSTDAWLRGVPQNPANGETSTPNGEESAGQIGTDIVPVNMQHVMAGLFMAADLAVDLAFPNTIPLLGMVNL